MLALHGNRAKLKSLACSIRAAEAAAAAPATSRFITGDTGNNVTPYIVDLVRPAVRASQRKERTQSKMFVPDLQVR